MVMALFGAPIEDARHADHAVAAAVAMTRELADLNRAWAARGGRGWPSASASTAAR